MDFKVLFVRIYKCCSWSNPRKTNQKRSTLGFSTWNLDTTL